jgi:hypothetical protein
MNWMYHIKYKIRAVFGLASIIVVILAGNLLLRVRLADLDKSMSSIMNDRLKPSAYIFDITHSAYQKRLLFADGVVNAQTVAEISRHSHTIDTLISSYEKTYLTTEEKKQWAAFKQHLDAYDHLEGLYFSGQTANKQAMAAEFAGVLNNLGNLSKIQIGEGNELQKHSRSVVDSTIAFSSVEIALLIVLGLFTMAILSISDHVLFNNKQQQSLN